MTGWLAVLALILAMALVVFLLLRPQQPSFEGKRLETWLADYNPNAGDEKSEKAACVIRNAGTNALPQLIDILGANTPRVNRLKSYAMRWLPFIPSRPQLDLQWKTVSAFKILGSIAGPAAPKLGELLERGRNPGYVSTALSHIGPEALPHLMMAMTNRNALVRFTAISATGHMGTNALPAVTVIQQALLDSETTVVEAAASALKELGIGRFDPAGTAEKTRANALNIR